MEKLNIAIFFGGCSSEYSVSLESASAVMDGLNRDKYNLIPVGITRGGDWFYYPGGTWDIREDRWQEDENCVPAVLSPSRESHELLLLRKGGVQCVAIDAAFPVMHGKNGEDGTLQGLIEMAGIPLIGCGTMASALCMDKNRAHLLASLAGVSVPRALVLTMSADRDRAREFVRQVGLPVYVKPVKAGSSYGITRLEHMEALDEAITRAFEHDDEVILEENIEGFEVGCAVLGTERLITGVVDEIELEDGFFDFTEKYTLKTAAIHVPARVLPEKAEEIKQTAMRVYRALGCSGFARVDMFLKPNGEIVFNEVNTIPGFTEHSRYPGMMRAAGYRFEEVLNRIVEQAVKKA